MKGQTLETILREEFDCSESEGALILPEGLRVTLLVNTGNSTLPLVRVRRVALHDNHLEVVTAEERYFIDTVDVFAVKQENFEPRNVNSRPGFHRE